jgi:hypothetical protein
MLVLMNNDKDTSALPLRTLVAVLVVFHVAFLLVGCEIQHGLVGPIEVDTPVGSLTIDAPLHQPYSTNAVPSP